MPWFWIKTENALDEFKDGLTKLGQVFKEQGVKDLIPELSPWKSRQKIDRQSTNESVIRISGQAEDERMLVNFVSEVRKLAEKYGGKRSNFMSSIQSTEFKNGVEYIEHEGGEGLFHVHLNFSLKD